MFYGRKHLQISDVMPSKEAVMGFSISIAQMEVAVAQPEKNLSKAEGWIAEAARRGSDLICFPEMWTTGFNWGANERMASEHTTTICHVASLAKRYRIWINGSFPTINEDGRIFNTSLLFDHMGLCRGVYRKIHLFSLLHEEQHMAAGQSITIVDTPWARTGLAICYDIRFPELFRTYALKGVEMVLCPIAFPYPRLEHWKILVRARAIENQMFMVGVNHVGSEDFGTDGVVTYFGSSVIVDPWGETVVEADESSETLLTTIVDTDKVRDIRNKMTVLHDRRPDIYDLSLV